jgi:hypothetical protein
VLIIIKNIIKVMKPEMFSKEISTSGYYNMSGSVRRAKELEAKKVEQQIKEVETNILFPKTSR